MIALIVDLYYVRSKYTFNNLGKGTSDLTWRGGGGFNVVIYLGKGTSDIARWGGLTVNTFSFVTG